MHTMRLIPVSSVCFLLTACGGGGGGSDSPAPPTATAPAPTPAPTPAPAPTPTTAPTPVPTDPVSVPAPVIQLAPSVTSITKDLSQGDEVQISLGGSWTGTNLGSSPVYLQLRDSTNGLVGEAHQLQSSAPLSTVITSVALAAGTHTGNFELRACADAECRSVYAGNTISLPYTFNVAAVTDWETHQRDAAHRGFVPITLKPSSFALAWKWTRPASTGRASGINAVATSGQKVYVTTLPYSSEATLYALDEATGSEAWKRSLGVVPALAPPAVSNGQVYAATVGYQNGFLWTFDAASGTYISKAEFSAQQQNLLAPTPSGSQVFTGGNDYSAAIYAFSTQKHTLGWVHVSGGVSDMFTPAVDDTMVYQYNGLVLDAYDRATGNRLLSIRDPFGQNADKSYFGSPVLGNRKNVFAFAGGASNWRGDVNMEQNDQRVISSFNLSSKTHEWASENAYLTTPAVANGIIYAGRNSPMSLDAIDEVTGKVLWSWVPSGDGDTSFHRNVVVTNNVLFASTDRAVYAIDLATRKSVWSYPQPGMLAISANRTLYIATGATASDGGLVAIKLK